MVRRLLGGLLLCGGVLAFGAGMTWAHDLAWGGQGAEHADPPDPGTLARYGEWVTEPGYGRVWKPSVEADWRPYWRGYWAWRGEWSWVSADPWGDGPSHYGEWGWSGRLGWVWIPGVVWAPARVIWIRAGSVVGWAPAGVQVAIGFDPRVWVYADAGAFRAPIVRPYRVVPPRAHLRHDIRGPNLGRVFPHAPESRIRPAHAPATRGGTSGRGHSRRFRAP